MENFSALSYLFSRLLPKLLILYLLQLDTLLLPSIHLLGLPIEMADASPCEPITRS